MAKGRTSFADLAGEPVLDAPLPALGPLPPRWRRVPVSLVAPNPANPRRDLGDLSDLASMRDGQLQPCAVVTRAAFLAVHPEHAVAVGSAEFVVVAGSRRRAAAELFELPTLDVTVQDDLAASPLSLLEAAVIENVGREDLSPLDEARAVESLVQAHGTAVAVAKRLGKSQTWVSQTRKLLGLSPRMQERLRAGELSAKEARAFKGSDDEQERAWREREAAIEDGRTWPPKGPAPLEDAPTSSIAVVDPWPSPGEDSEPASPDTTPDPVVVPVDPGPPTPEPIRQAPAPAPNERPRPLRYPATGQPGDFVRDWFESWPRDFVEAAVAEAAARIKDRTGLDNRRSMI